MWCSQKRMRQQCLQIAGRGSHMRSRTLLGGSREQACMLWMQPGMLLHQCSATKLQNPQQRWRSMPG